MLETRIQVLIKEDTEIGQYSDALYFSEDEFNKLSADEIKDLAKARVDNWVNLVKEQSKKIPVEPTESELLAEKATLEEKLDIINNQLSE